MNKVAYFSAELDTTLHRLSQFTLVTRTRARECELESDQLFGARFSEMLGCPKLLEYPSEMEIP